MSDSCKQGINDGSEAKHSSGLELCVKSVLYRATRDVIGHLVVPTSLMHSVCSAE